MLEKQKKYKRILKFTEDYSSKYGYSPTLSEIAKYSGISVSTAFRYVKELEDAGLICGNSGKKRGISPKAEKGRGKAVPVPVYSEAVAGDGSLFSEKNILFYLWLPISRFKNGEYFASEAEKSWFLPEKCKEGDYVIFKKTNRAKNGDIVMLRNKNKEETVKIEYLPDGFSITKAGSKKRKEAEIEIIGKIVAIQRLEI